MNILFGIFLIGLGTFSAGSFAVPFTKIRSWNWEMYWMVFSIGAYVFNTVHYFIPLVHPKNKVSIFNGVKAFNDNNR